MKKLIPLAAMAALFAANAQEVLTLPGGTQVMVENKTTGPGILALPGGGTEVTVENNLTVRIIETKKREPEPQTRKMAVFVRNSCKDVDAADGAETKILDLVLGMAPDGLELIDPRNTVYAIEALPKAIPTAEGVTQERRKAYLQAEVNRIQGNRQKNLGGPGTTTDEDLKAQTSISRLAQNMAADYVMLLTLIDVEFVDPEEDAPGKWTHITTMDASYQVMDSLGFSIGRGTLTSKLIEQKTAKKVATKMPAGLNRKMAQALSEKIAKDEPKWRASTLIGTRVPVRFDAQAMTMDRQPIYVPEFNKEKKEVVLDSQIPVRVAALVEVDGITVGTTDCEVYLVPGLSKVRINRQGMDDVNMTIQVKEGLVINAPMRITEGEMDRILKLQDAIHKRTADRSLAEAYATFLENSHFRVDATNLPDTHILYAPHVTPVNNININNNTAVGVGVGN